MRFLADRFSLGEPDIDKDFSLTLKSRLFSDVTYTLPDSERPPASGSSDAAALAPASGAEAAATEASSGGSDAAGVSPASSGAAIAAAAPAEAGGAAPENASPAAPVAAVVYQKSQLSCHVDLRFTLKLPHPLSLVPRPLLQHAGNLLTKVTMQALLPNFLDLLSTDYQRWAQGTRQQAAPVGSLLSAGGADAAATAAAGTGATASSESAGAVSTVVSASKDGEAGAGSGGSAGAAALQSEPGAAGSDAQPFAAQRDLVSSRPPA